MSLHSAWWAAALLAVSGLVSPPRLAHAMSHSQYWASHIQKRDANVANQDATAEGVADHISYHGSGHGLDEPPHGLVLDDNSSSATLPGHKRRPTHHYEPQRAHDQYYTYCVERDPLHEQHGIHVASWRWDEVRPYYAITLFIAIAGLAKLGFHHAHFLSSKVPESCLLILLGIAMGLVTFHFRRVVHDEGLPDIVLPNHHGDVSLIAACQAERSAFLPNFDSHLFFLVLLPPIILEASYSLHDRTFANNLGTILLYAVVGTLFNMFTIGPLLYGLAKVGAMGSNMFPAHDNYDIANVSMVQTLTFASLIVAVDPVAVLAIFQEVGVNKDLYFLVFGESLLNDAVTVVLYNAMVAFAGQGDTPITYDQLLLAVAAFLCVSLGGLAIGIIFGVLTAVVTKFTSEVPVVEPLSLLALAYLSYLTAELVHFSGIIATVGCGVVQAHYATKNISKNSYITIKYFVSMASGTSDTIIFMFLGMVLVSDDHRWHTGFCLWTLVLCLLFRFLGVYLLTAIANRYRMNRIGMKEQFIMAYGGLRGAVGFSLVVMLGDNVIDRETAQVFVTCTLFIVLFTVFVQGSTIKVFVNIFGIKLDDDEEKTLAEEVVESSMDHIAEGVEEIVGFGGLNRLKERLETWDEKYVTPWLVHTEPMSALARLYDKLVLDEHYANLYGPAAVLETQKEFDTASVDSSLPSYPTFTRKERLGSIVPAELALELEPGWMRRKSTLGSPTNEIVRRLSSAVNLPLPEDEPLWLRRVSATSPDMPAARPSLSDARRLSLLPGAAAGGAARRLSLLPPAATGGGQRRVSIVDGFRTSFARRLSVFGGGVQDHKGADGEADEHQRRDSVLARSPSPNSDAHMLRSAIRDNPFNKLHHRHNPTLLDEEDQELESHLRRRRINARRLSQMAFLPPTAQTMLALTEQAESSATGSPLSRVSTRRQSYHIRRSPRDTPPVRSRSNSQPMANLNGNQLPPAFETKSAKTTRASSSDSGSSWSAERTGHANPTFVITEESDYESEPCNAGSRPPAAVARRPPTDVASRPPTDVASRPPADVASCPPADVASRPPTDVASRPPADVASRPPVDVTCVAAGAATTDPPGAPQLPVIRVTEEEKSDPCPDVTISKL